jgi:hypothetical protein
MDRLDKQKLLNIYDDLASSHQTLLNGLKTTKDEEPKEIRLRERKIAVINTLMTNILKLKNLLENS